jgi:beta-glucanase (GH16 family)
VGGGGGDEQPEQDLLISGCPDMPRQNDAGQTLVFCDDFLGSEVNREIWSMEEGMLRNQEEQCYLDRPENIIVEQGELVIRAIPETVDDPLCMRQWGDDEPTPANYSSASLLTRDVAAFTYGRIEARLKVPASTGAWPAFWMRPQDQVYGGWPRSGEIDVMEYVSQDANLLHGTVHYDFLGHEEDGGSIDLGSPASAEYHIVAVDWTPTQMAWFVDGTLYHTFDSSRDIQGIRPFDESFYLVLNLAVGGTWPEDPDPADYPDEFRVDWVRVYQTQ